MVKAARTGLLFTVEGEYAEELHEDENQTYWQPLEMRELHPGGKAWFTIWSNWSELDEQKKQEMIREAVTVVNWMKGEKGWQGFDAELLLRAPGGPVQVHRWMLC